MRLHFTASAAPLAQQAFKELTAIHPNTPIEEADVNVVLSGDGETLKEMKKALINKKRIYGLNCGHRGYLMNPLYHNQSLIKRIENAITVNFHPLDITASLRDQPEEIHLSAFNEGVVRRLTTQSAHLRISYVLDGQKKVLAELNHCDGGIFTTPLGSKAYWEAVGGRSIPWCRPVLGVHSICSRDKLDKRVSNNAEIIVESLESDKRPVIVSGDNQECTRPISSCRIAMNHEKQAQVMFDPMVLWKKRLAQYIR